MLTQRYLDMNLYGSSTSLEEKVQGELKGLEFWKHQRPIVEWQITLDQELTKQLTSIVEVFAL
jgi:hypothetical protein